jgi:hypothetical protein
MNQNIFTYLMALAVISCVPSRTIPETVDIDRDRRWSACRFYVIDHDCGTISDLYEQRECAFSAESEYLSVPSSQQRQWLRSHGCSYGVIRELARRGL